MIDAGQHYASGEKLLGSISRNAGMQTEPTVAPNYCALPPWPDANRESIGQSLLGVAG
jgi:hypothetical protein